MHIHIHIHTHIDVHVIHVFYLMKSMEVVDIHVYV